MSSKLSKMRRDAEQINSVVKSLRKRDYPFWLIVDFYLVEVDAFSKKFDVEFCAANSYIQDHK